MYILGSADPVDSNVGNELTDASAPPVWAVWSVLAVLPFCSPFCSASLRTGLRSIKLANSTSWLVVVVSFGLLPRLNSAHKQTATTMAQRMTPPSTISRM